MELGADRGQLLAVCDARNVVTLYFPVRHLAVLVVRAPHCHLARGQRDTVKLREDHEDARHDARRDAAVGDELEGGEVDVRRVVAALEEFILRRLGDRLVFLAQQRLRRQLGAQLGDLLLQRDLALRLIERHVPAQLLLRRPLPLQRRLCARVRQVGVADRPVVLGAPRGEQRALLLHCMQLREQLASPTEAREPLFPYLDLTIEPSGLCVARVAW